MVLRRKSTKLNCERCTRSLDAGEHGLCYALYLGNPSRIENATIKGKSALCIFTQRAEVLVLHLYEIPLNVVPISNARTSFRRGPSKGARNGREAMQSVLGKYRNEANLTSWDWTRRDLIVICNGSAQWVCFSSPSIFTVTSVIDNDMHTITALRLQSPPYPL